MTLTELPMISFHCISFKSDVSEHAVPACDY